MSYYVFMPNLWWLGIITFFIPYEVILTQLIVKQFIVIGAHSKWKWDQTLYKFKVLHPLAWIVERSISTPSTHFMHHGKSNSDGISNNNGNLSNMFFSGISFLDPLKSQGNTQRFMKLRMIPMTHGLHIFTTH